MNLNVKQNQNNEAPVLGIHAHVYYDEKTFSNAVSLVAKVKEKLPLVQVGTLWKKPVGPHPRWSCQLSCHKEQFAELLFWLVQERGQLTIFAHIVTGDDVFDHTQGVIWLGESEKLNLHIFS